MQDSGLARRRAEFLRLRFGMFIHFNMGTFHGQEWVLPGQDPATFNPDRLDCGQWADVALSAGMRYGALTVKHHDGFCLWDSAVSSYSVARSPLAGRDIVAEYCAAFRARGLQPHLYFSVWDRTLGIEGPFGAEGMAQIKGQLQELLTGYGPIGSVTFDGWSQGAGAEWRENQRDEIFAFAHSLQPDVLMTDHFQIRRGLPFADVYDKIGFLHFEDAEPVNEFVPEGNPFAAQQGPTLQSHWFWRESFPTDELMSVADIVDARLKPLATRNCNLLLNCAPNASGLMDDNVVQRLAEVGRAYHGWSGQPA